MYVIYGYVTLYKNIHYFYFYIICLSASPVHRARKNTPRRTPNSVQRRWGRRKEYSTSEENDVSTKKVKMWQYAFLNLTILSRIE